MITIASRYELPRKETETLVSWISREMFKPPRSPWAAIAVEMVTNGPGKDNGLGGNFYAPDGTAFFESFNPDAKHLLHDDDGPVGRWIEATYNIARVPWKACLIHLIRRTDGLFARFEFDLTDPERWSEAVYGGRLVDVMRPPELPIPLTTRR